MYSTEHWLAKKAATSTTLNVGGKTITLNALLRMAPSAVEKAKVFTKGNAALFAGTLVASYLLDHYMMANDGNEWKQGVATPWNPSTPGTGGAGSSACPVHPSNAAADSWPIGYKCILGGNSFAYVKAYTSPHGCAWTVHKNLAPTKIICGTNTFTTLTPPTVTYSPPTDANWDTAFPPTLPDPVLDEIAKKTPMPVDLPIINPGPGDFPMPQVRRIPLGDFSPYPSPNSTTSTQYRAPILDLIPSPTQTDPWRVDAQPKDIVTEVPNGDPPPESIKDPVDVPTDSPTSTETENKTPGLCEMYPDILACAKPELDKPEEAIPKKTENIEFTEMNLWGGGSCPANVSVSVNGQSITALEMAQMCGWIQTYLQPMVILASSLSAMFILMGSRGSDAL